METFPAGAEFFHADGGTESFVEANVDFHSSAKALKICEATGLPAQEDQA